jgi:hypothetical protein
MIHRAGSTARPVFVDSTGTRRRFFTLFGVVAGVLLTITTAMLVAGFVGGASGHLPGLSRPGQVAGQTPAPDGTSPHATPTTRPSASTSRTGTPAPVTTTVAPPGQAGSTAGHRNTAHPTPSHR